MPPMPRVSAMVWRRPILLRHLEIGDRAGLVAADLEGGDHEVRAVEGLALVGEGLDRGLGAQRLDRACSRRSSLSSSRCGLMSISAMSASASAWRCSTSPTMFFMNTVEPAPMKVIFGLGMSVGAAGGALLESCGEARELCPALQWHTPASPSGFTDDGKPWRYQETEGHPCPFI